MGFFFDLFLPRLFLIDILFLHLSLHIDDEILQILKIEILPFFLRLLLVDSLSHLEEIYPLLQDLVHQHVPHLIFLAHHCSFSVLSEHSSKRVDVSLNGRAPSIAKDDDIIASVEELKEVLQAFLEDVVDDIEELDFLRLEVPNLVGCF